MTSSQAPNPDILAFLTDLAALGRQDAHGMKRKAEGGYVKLDVALSDTLIRDHLNKGVARAVYPLVGAFTRIACFDLDAHNDSATFAEVVGVANRIGKQLDQYGIKYSMFRSGGGNGIHNWIVFETPQSATDVRRRLVSVAKSVGLTEGAGGVAEHQVEIFPKQDDARAGYGNSIALPLGRKSLPLSDAGVVIPLSGWTPPILSSLMNTSLDGIPLPPSPRKKKPKPRRRSVTVAQVQDLLKRIPGDDYDDWIKVGYALKWELGDEGEDVWREWSSKAEKAADDADIAKRWEGFKPDGRANYGTLFSLAVKAGWEPDLDAVIAEMNVRFGILTQGSRTTIIDKIESLKVPGYVSLGKEPLFDRIQGEGLIDVGNKEPVNKAEFWFDDPRAARYNSVIFDPAAPPGDNGSSWNTWKGFPIQPREGRWDLFDRHIFEVIAAGDDDAYNWVLNWIAFGLQYPAKLTGTALVLKGEPGTGKGIFANLLGALWEPHYLTVTNREHVAGRFSGQFIGIRLVFVDEAESSPRGGGGTLKTRITEPKILFERKGIDPITFDNRLIFIMASNEEVATTADHKDRRLMILKVSAAKREDRAWFDAIDHQMRNGGLEAMAYDLLGRDVTIGPDPRRIIRNAALFDEVISGSSHEVQYAYGLLQTGTLPLADAAEANVTVLAALWADYRDKRGGPYGSSQAMFAKRLQAAITGISTSQSIRPALTGVDGTQRSTLYVFRPLAECRAAFESMIGAPVSWDTSITDWQMSDRPF